MSEIPDEVLKYGTNLLTKFQNEKNEYGKLQLFIANCIAKNNGYELFLIPNNRKFDYKTEYVGDLYTKEYETDKCWLKIEYGFIFCIHFKYDKSYKLNMSLCVLSASPNDITEILNPLFKFEENILICGSE